MIHRFMIWITKQIPLVVLLVVLIGVTWKNYPTSSQLIGWDSVQPELDYAINLKRSLTTVWMENQGAGHIGGHGYATIFIQGIIESLISLVVGVVQTRGVFVFAMLWLGPLGMYLLWKSVIAGDNKFREWGAMLSGVFYLLNLGTVQTFFAPLEAFVIMYGLLPWAVWSVLRFLEVSSRRNLLILVLIQLIFSMIGFIPPQFVAYGMVLAAIFFGFIFFGKGSLFDKLGRLITVVMVVVAVNAYWLFPVAYYSLNNSQDYVAAKNNQVSTPDFQYMSEARGKWGDVATLRGFFFDSSDTNILGDGKFFSIFGEWHKYLQPNILWVGYGLFAIAMLGTLSMCINLNVRRFGVTTFVIILVGWIAIAQAEEPFSTLATWVHHIPVIGQAFRASFTKFVSILILGYSIGFGYGGYVIYCIFKRNSIFTGLILGILISGLIVFTKPIFVGYLLYSPIKVNLPNSYVELFRYFNNEPKQARIAYMPSAWMWGWQLHNWGYSGSGFLWYGIEQPILDRAFDVWSPYNETFYNQLATALYQCPVDHSGSDLAGLPTKPFGEAQGRFDPKCSADVQRVLAQYDVRYVLLDESVIAPGQDKKILRIDETKKIAEELGWKEKFQDGFLTVYEIPIRSDLVGIPTRSDLEFVIAPTTYTLAEGDTTYGRVDHIYLDNGTYVSGLGGAKYPFANLMKEEVKGVEYKENEILIRSNLVGVPTTSVLETPALQIGDEIEAIYTAELKGGKINIVFEPLYKVNEIDGPKLPAQEIEIDKAVSLWLKVGDAEAVWIKDGEKVRRSVVMQIGMPASIRVYEGEGEQIDITSSWDDGHIQKCWDNGNPDAYATGLITEDNVLRFEIENAAGCLAIPTPALKQDSLIQGVVEYKSPSGGRPDFCFDLEGEPYRCENKLVWEVVPTSKDWTPLSRTVAGKTGDKYWLDISARPNKNEKQLIEYKYPQLLLYGLVANLELDIDIWNEYLRSTLINFDSNQLTLRVPSAVRSYSLATFGKEEIENCDVLKRGVAGKLNDDNGDSIYRADASGVACDYVNMFDLSTELSYLMRIQGETTTGREPKFYLWNSGNEKNDIEYLLDKGKFDQSFSLLGGDNEGLYSLNFEVRSFGQLAINKLETIETRYFPSQTLARAKIYPRRSDLVGIPTRSDLEITDVKKTGTWKYKVKVTGSGLLALSQGYDEGWVGYAVTSATVSQLEHVKVDGWKNGWVVKEGQENITIFYWPQLLQYLGLGILGITLFLLVLLRRQ